MKANNLKSNRSKKVPLGMLSEFSTKRSNFKKHPKKEYLMVMLIRGLKRALRQIKKGEHPEKLIHRFDESDEVSKKIWVILQAVYESNTEEFDQISNPINGPKPDGFSKRKQADDSLAKSYNKAYCSEFLNSNSIKIAWYYYILLIFAHIDIPVLCEKFGFFCCQQTHSLTCDIKWLALKNYLTKELLIELDVSPWIPGEIQLPSYLEIKHQLAL